MAKRPSITELKARVRDLEAQIDAFRADAGKALIDEVALLSMKYDGQAFEGRLASPLFGVIASWCERDLGEAPNFTVTEFTVTRADLSGSFTVTIQRRGKLSPADRWLDVCKERDDLRRKLAAIEAGKEASVAQRNAE